ncbi:hypothetical protein SEVIR_3G267575v4 [Setaria viridis]
MRNCVMAFQNSTKKGNETSYTLSLSKKKKKTKGKHGRFLHECSMTRHMETYMNARCRGTLNTLLLSSMPFSTPNYIVHALDSSKHARTGNVRISSVGQR